MRKSQSQGVFYLDRLADVKKNPQKNCITKTRKNVYLSHRRQEVGIMVLKITPNQHMVTRLGLSAFAFY